VCHDVVLVDSNIRGYNITRIRAVDIDNDNTLDELIAKEIERGIHGLFEPSSRSHHIPFNRRNIFHTVQSNWTVDRVIKISRRHQWRSLCLVDWFLKVVKDDNAMNTNILFDSSSSKE
jgi:hypothetical protein